MQYDLHRRIFTGPPDIFFFYQI